MNTSYKIIFLIFFGLSVTSCEKEPIVNPVDGEGSENENCEVAVMYNVREGSTENKNFKIGLFINGERRIIVEDDSYDFWWPRLHPSKSYFICYRSPIGDATPTNDYTRAELWRFDLDGSNAKKLIDLDDYNWQAHGTADWSPDGKYLVMFALADDEQHLFRTDADGKNLKQLTDGKGHRGDPAWSPDGSQIIYTAFPQDYKWNDPVKNLLDIGLGTPLEIHTADISSGGSLSNITRITNDNFKDFDPYMSPDGKLIAWESFENLDGSMKMYDVEEKVTSTIFDNEFLPCCPSWYPDSERFLYHSSKLFVPFFISSYNLKTKENEIILQASDTDYSNAQYVCWPK